MKVSVNPIADLRSHLADKRAELRGLNDRLPWARAQAETRVITQAGDEKALGSNAEARARALTLALYADDAYLATLSEIRAVEREIADLESELEGLYDQRRASEWAIRARLVDALLGQGFDHPGNGTGSTSMLTEMATRQALRDAAERKQQALTDTEDLWR